ncbi:hypothetical protein [Hyalangium rubrum]|uniref:4-vinyl reductase 4VR domain-containing protein n=1 Tax=Hyalangium rubrum TaxID=3103134 RepID=A0ABU5H724_9BACT|nr:hypothetical protein [Hyalangium sp. s54d21]MDY7228552.1 hypothetical protein [Hyalangium sp. s54d21]
MMQSTKTARIEVLGNSILSALGAMKIAPDRALRIFAEQGITTIESTDWYPVEHVLGAYRSIQAQVGPHTIRAVGRNILKNAEFPPGLTTIEQALGSLDVAYHMNHRGSGPMGGYHHESTSPRTSLMTCDNLYPCPMDLGLLEAIAERFRPRDAFLIRVQHASSTCRERGDSACVYSLSW